MAGTDEFDIYTGESFIEFKPPVGYNENQLEQYMDVNCTCDGLPRKIGTKAKSGNCASILPSECNGYTSDIGKGTCNFEGADNPNLDAKLCQKCEALRKRYLKCLEEINSWCKQHDRDREASCKAWQKKIL